MGVDTMKIDRVSEIMPLREDKVVLRAYRSQTSSNNDNLMLSQVGRLSQEINVAVSKTAAVRTDKVNALKQAIANKQYQVKPELVAAKLLTHIAE
jgi:anti-sigma28 factor (negative regulator of flagellin synthesis)